MIAAEQVEEIEGLEWPEFGMPEAFWILRVKEFGPLIVSIDTEGNNFIEEKKNTFRERQKEESAKVEKFVASFMQSH